MGAETFWARVASYNEALWPVQAILIFLAVFLTYRVIARPGPRTDVWTKVFFSFAFAWNGIVVFPVYLKSTISIVIGTPLFVIVAILFAVDIWTQKTAFRLPDGRWRQALTFAWLALVALYPLIGWAFVGHVYPQALLPAMPCPLTVFALTLVAAAAPRADRKVFVALLPWALLGLPKCLGAMDCYEDCILFASGVYGLIVLIRTWKVRPAADHAVVRSALRSHWFTWSPSRDTLVALLTEIAMIAVYWATTHLLNRGWETVLGLGVLTNLGLNVLLPVWWIAWHRREPLSELGLTRRHWLRSLLIGAGLAAFSAFGLRRRAADTDWLPHLLFNAVILWEPFFVFGWLQLRFDRAFGIVPGVLLAALSFAAYHIGSYPPAMLVVLLITGLFYAVVFRLTSNLLTLWPLLWSVGSSIGTLMGGMQFTWTEVAIWAVILLIQLGFIGYTSWRQQEEGEHLR